MFRWLKTRFTRTATAPVRRHRLGVEFFEARSLPSAAVGLNALTHVLAVNGTAGSDQIQISTTGNTIQVDVNGRIYSFAASSVSQVSARGGAGNDSIVNNTGLAFTARGGAGNDTLLGGNGSNVLLGGIGNDVLVGSGTSNTLNGGAGRDRVEGTGTGCEAGLLSASLTGDSGGTGQVTLLPHAAGLRVDVTGLTANTTYTLDVGGTTVGTFTTDDTGAADVTLDASAVTVAAGTTVSVLDDTAATVLTGTFAAPTSGTGTSGSTTTLAADLTDPTGNSSATGTASALSSTTAGQTSLRLDVTGLTANTTYTVDVAGTTVGTFTTDDAGVGSLKLTGLTQTIASGDAITVLDDTGATVLSGTFASSGTSGGGTGDGDPCGGGGGFGGPGGAGGFRRR